MIALIIMQFFHNGYEWLTIQDLNGIDYESQLLPSVAALMAGFGIPIIGACMQVTTRNKLAEPTTLGFYPVVFMGMLLSQLSLGNNTTNYIFPLLLSFGVVAINFLVVRGKPGQQTFKSILIGFAINAIITGVNYLIQNYTKAVGNPLAWLSGNFGSPTREKIIISSILIICSTSILFMLIPFFNIIQKDYILAKTLGIKVDLIYWIVAACAIVTTVSSVIIIGGVILLGIVVPHLVRMIFRTEDNRIVLLMSGIFGMFLLSMSMWLVNAISYYTAFTLNINILTAILAIPVFILILKKGKN